MTATVGRVARPRGELHPVDAAYLVAAADEVAQWQKEYRRRVVRALDQGASFSEVSKATGLSTNTLQRWKRESEQ